MVSTHISRNINLALNHVSCMVHTFVISRKRWTLDSTYHSPASGAFLRRRTFSMNHLLLWRLELDLRLNLRGTGKCPVSRPTGRSSMITFRRNCVHGDHLSVCQCIHTEPVVLHPFPHPAIRRAKVLRATNTNSMCWGLNDVVYL